MLLASSRESRAAKRVNSTGQPPPQRMTLCNVSRVKKLLNKVVLLLLLYRER